MTERSGKKQIVIIDDDPSIQRVMHRLLSHQYNVVAVDSGAELLPQLVELKPSLIILDIGLPWINGYDLCDMIRHNPILKDTPVLIVSGRWQFVDMVTGMEVGANRYLTKPFDPGSLVETVDLMVGQPAWKN